MADGRIERMRFLGNGTGFRVDDHTPGKLDVSSVAADQRYFVVTKQSGRDGYSSRSIGRNACRGLAASWYGVVEVGATPRPGASLNGSCESADSYHDQCLDHTDSAIRIFGSNNRCRDDYCISFVAPADEVPPRSVRRVGLAFLRGKPAVYGDDQDVCRLRVSRASNRSRGHGRTSRKSTIHYNVQ